MKRAAIGRRSAALVLLAVAVGLVVAACGGSGKSNKKSTEATSDHSVAQTWSLPNADAWDNRTVASKIDSSNVKKLKVAWTLPLPSGYTSYFGTFASTPVFSNGIVYLQDLGNNVYAVNESNGQVQWEYKVPKTATNGEGPNGVAVVNGVVYGETNRDAFALQATTGEQLWKTPNLAGKVGQGFNIAPLVANGIEYVSTSGQLKGGVAYALNADTGKVIWSFQETKDPAERSLGGTDGTGGAWGTPLLIGNSLYLGIANPYRSINDAINKPTKLPYNDSTISLNAKTGKLQWAYQAVPNDFHDWDMQIGPMYAPSGPSGKPTVIDAGKMGFVYAYDAKTGKLFWKTSVGTHDGHDNDAQLALEGKWSKPKLPYVYCPGIYGGVETQMAESDGIVYVPVNNLCSVFKTYNQPIAGPDGSLTSATGNMEAIDLKTGKVLWNDKLPASAFGAATVTNDLVFTTTFDGKVYAFDKKTGKTVWTEKLPAATNSPVAVDGNMLIAPAGFASGKGQKNQIVAYSLNAPAKPTTNTAPASSTGTSTSSSSSSSSTSTSSSSSSSSSGAVSVMAGAKVFVTNCAACHTLSEVSATGKVGPDLDQLKPSDALVVHQVTNGGGGMPAFGSQLSKTQIQAVAKFVSTVAGTGKKVQGVTSGAAAG